MAQVQGECDAKFDTVRNLLQGFLDSGEECGAAIVVNLHGKNVIDIWGGYKDAAKTSPWTQDTIVNVWSCTKMVTNLSALMAMDRGLLTPTTKVSEIWPEFASNGKEDIEVRMLLSHTSGLSGWTEKLEYADLYNSAKVTQLLAEQAPWWKPGTASGYHATTQGYLVGEVIRRTTGKSLTQFVADEISGPMKADFQIGCIKEDWSRVAELEPPPPLMGSGEFDPESIAIRTVINPFPNAAAANTPEFRLAEIGAANGHSNARALAKIFSAVTLGGQLDGVRLLKPETIELIFQEQSLGTDLVIGSPIRFGIGYALRSKDTVVDWIPDGKICFWAGWGGSFVIMDFERGLTFAYVMNKMGPGTLGNSRTEEYVKALYSALGQAVKL